MTEHTLSNPLRFPQHLPSSRGESFAPRAWVDVIRGWYPEAQCRDHCCQWKEVICISPLKKDERRRSGIVFCPF